MPEYYVYIWLNGVNRQAAVAVLLSFTVHHCGIICRRSPVSLGLRFPDPLLEFYHWTPSHRFLYESPFQIPYLPPGSVECFRLLQEEGKKIVGSELVSLMI